MKLLLFSIVFLLSVTVYGQDSNPFDNPKTKAAIEAYTLVSVIENSLSFLKDKYPNVEQKASLNLSKFKVKYGKGEAKIKEYLFKNLREEKIIELQNQIQKASEVVIKEFDKWDEPKSLKSIDKINDLEKLENGKLARTLVGFQFNDKPIEELNAGFIQKVVKTNEYDSEKIRWQINVPTSWESVESSVSGNVQKHFKYNFGSLNIDLFVFGESFNVSRNRTIPQKDLDKILKAGNTIKNGKLASKSKTIINKKVAYVFEYNLNPGGIADKTINTFIITGNGFYSISYLIKKNTTEQDLNNELKKYRPVFNIINNSFKFYL